MDIMIILSNLPRIVDRSNYYQSPNTDLIIDGNSFEFVTFSVNLISIVGYSMIQFSSNTFTHIGFFSESLMRSVFQQMQNPISVCIEYTSDPLRSVQQTMILNVDSCSNIVVDGLSIDDYWELDNPKLIPSINQLSCNLIYSKCSLNFYLSNLKLTNMRGVAGNTIQSFINTDSSVISSLATEDMLFTNSLLSAYNLMYFTILNFTISDSFIRLKNTEASLIKLAVTNSTTLQIVNQIQTILLSNITIQNMYCYDDCNVILINMDSEVFGVTVGFDNSDPADNMTLSVPIKLNSIMNILTINYLESNSSSDNPNVSISNVTCLGSPQSRSQNIRILKKY